MEQIEELSRFIKEHASDDLNRSVAFRLSLSGDRYPFRGGSIKISAADQG